MTYAKAATQHRIKTLEQLADQFNIKTDVFYLRGLDTEERLWTDTEKPFRQESFFWYLTGCNEPGCHLLVDIKERKSYLLVPRFSSDHVVWCGEGLTPQDAITLYGVDACLYADELSTLLKQLNPSQVHVLDQTPQGHLDVLSQMTLNPRHLRQAIIEARVIKTPMEIDLMKKAAKITGDAHIALMKSLNSGQIQNEQELHALFEYECFRHGGRFQAYTPIVAGGKAAATLHYIKNNVDLPKNKSDMLLVDAGCEYNLYASDVTRTYPLNGKFIEEWKTTYEIVLNAQKAVLSALKPGILWEDMHRLANQVICEGLVKAGILVGTTKELIEHHIPALFFPHGLGHMLGIDVHDCGGYPPGVERIAEPGIRYLRMRRELKPGMVVTVEPGCYFIDALLGPALDNPEQRKYLNVPVLTRFREKVGGVRIEDDVVITETGIDNLTGWIPKEVADIEAIMA